MKEYHRLNWDYFLVSLTKPIIELIVRNTLIHTEGIDRNFFWFTFRFVEEPESFKITIAKHKSYFWLMMQRYFERVYQSIRHFWTLTTYFYDSGFQYILMECLKKTNKIHVSLMAFVESFDRKQFTVRLSRRILIPYRDATSINIKEITMTMLFWIFF